jgi:hypothetical protein
VGNIEFELGLFEDAPDLVADLPGLLEAAVRQRRIIGRGRAEVPLFVGGVESVAVSGSGELVKRIRRSSQAEAQGRTTYRTTKMCKGGAGIVPGCQVVGKEFWSKCCDSARWYWGKKWQRLSIWGSKAKGACTKRIR